MPNNPNAVDNLIPIKKGEVRNPKGYPKGVPHTKTRLIRLLELTNKLENPITGEMEGFTVAEQMDLAQVMKAMKGDTTSYKELVDRLEGKAQQNLGIGDMDGNKLDITITTENILKQEDE